jgi:nitroimidazol reductase NimA-like FMN-containing flavoprotein (pyridoxamine 5'-phosphate oxidase superfamily)
MMSSGEPMTVLSADESWHLLSSMALGRLVSCVEGRPEIFPVNFVVQRRTVLFRTAERATKLFTVVMNNQVAFEADDHNVLEGWSVIVKGQARVLNDLAEIQEAERAQLLPWTQGVKSRYVRVSPSEISGRRFRFGSVPSDRSVSGPSN